MPGKGLSRRSRKQFHRPLPLLATAEAPFIPPHTRARVTPPPPQLLTGHHHRGPVRGLGQTAQAVIPGSRRIHQPAPSPQLYAGRTRRGWLDQQTQPRPVAWKHRSNWPHGICLESSGIKAAFTRPDKKGNNGGGNKPPPKPKPETAAPIIPGSRRVHSSTPLRSLHGHVRRGRTPGVDITPFIRLHGRRVQNPQAQAPPRKGHFIRHIPAVIPSGQSASQVVNGHRWARGPVLWEALRPAVWRGRVPGPTVPFLLREGRRSRGTLPPPGTGQTHRGSLPRPLQVAGVLIPRHQFCRVILPPGSLLEGIIRRGLLFHTGDSAQVVLLPCDVLPLRVEQDEDCALRPEVSSDPGQRVQEEESCPARPPRCPDET